MSPKLSIHKRSCLSIPLGILGVFVILIAISALSNLGLPQQSKTQDYLSELEKARLSEALQLRRSLGDATWPGWSQADIPIIEYNEKYAFLVGYPDPPSGWKKVPSMEQRGGPWEAVPGDTFDGQPYYRTPITDPLKTPQSFTVLVGDMWVATFQTREYSQVNFYHEFRQQLPPVLSNLVPVRLVWALLMSQSESHIAALEHESFHAYEGMLNLDQFSASEQMYSVEQTYPYDAIQAAWKQEMDVLIRAAQASTTAEASNLAHQFLQLRLARRQSLTPDQVQLERLREWEEGLAKYVELEITRQAADDRTYLPVEVMIQDKSFNNYADRQQFWSSQLKEAANVQGISGDTRFYYSGNAMAVLLDQVMPGWKARAVPGGEFLDDLLQEAVK
jgi:hypothetical protein